MAWALRGGTAYLTLRSSEAGDRRIAVVSDFDAALRNWPAGTRISPVFALNGAKAPRFAGRGHSFVVFLGPIFIGDIATIARARLFASLGLFNVIAFCPDAVSCRAMLAEARRLGTNWEQWTVRGDRVTAIKSGTHIAAPTAAVPKIRPLEGATAFRATAQEYLALMASAIALRSRYIPNAVNELIAVDSWMRAMLASADIDAVTKQTYLVNINATLSRQTSQAFAGTSPIPEHECHLWSHSLLGIGTASLALEGIIGFVTKIVQDTRIVERVAALESRPAIDQPLEGVQQGHSVWHEDHLSAVQLGNPGADPIRLVTCFSGRDGFRSKDNTICVPLELLSSGNTAAWTPLTITHEISHIIVAGILGELVPPPQDAAQLDRVLGVLHGGRRPVHLLDQVRSYLALALCRLAEPNSGGTRNYTSADLALIIERNYAEVNELCTHCFDYLYFYRRDPRHYVRSIWASWDVIPNIGSRLVEYLTRTLCALHTGNISRASGRHATVDQLIELLSELVQAAPHSHYIAPAVKMLRGQPLAFERHLRVREPIVKLVKAFLFSPEIARVFNRDHNLVAGDEHGGYRLQWQRFTRERATNPLRFVDQFARDIDPDATRSAWMVHHLAFCQP